jgi:hypothetical protein
MSAVGATHLPTFFVIACFMFSEKETSMPSVCKKNCNLHYENKNEAKNTHYS